jgi:hypothetical protein
MTNAPIRGTWLALLLAFGTVSSTAAQESPPRRQGFWLLIGASYGSASIDCDQCNAGYDPGLAGTLALGTTLNQQLLVGVESDWWTRDDNDVWTSVGVVSAVAYVFPRRDMGLFFKGGAGVAGFHSTGFGPNKDQFGFGVIGGVGYEFPVNRSFSLAPTASYHWGTLGDEGAFTGLSQSLIQVGVGVYLP